MDIFTALIGGNIDEIEKAKNFTSKEEAKGFVEKEKGENKGGIISGEVDEPDKLNEKDNQNQDEQSWSVVDNQRIDGVLCRNKTNTDLWLIIKIDGRSIQTNFIDMTDKKCKDCEESLIPHTSNISRCNNCESLFKNGSKIQESELNEIINATRSINIEVSDDEESEINEEKIEFNSKDKLPDMLENGEF